MLRKIKKLKIKIETEIHKQFPEMDIRVVTREDLEPPHFSLEIVGLNANITAEDEIRDEFLLDEKSWIFDPRNFIAFQVFLEGLGLVMDKMWFNADRDAFIRIVESEELSMDSLFG